MAKSSSLFGTVAGPASWQLRAVARAVAKRVLSRVPVVMVGVLLLNNALWFLRLASGRIRSFSFAKHYSLSPAESARYIEDVFEDYKLYGQVDRFWGEVAEIGPGDSAGVALLMRGDGCTQVDLIDQFASVSDAEQQMAIYRELAAKYPVGEIVERAHRGSQLELPGVQWKVGVSAETYFHQCVRDGIGYDVIVSRAVMEHLYDPLRALQDMVSTLRSGGLMIHKIDLRDHNLFSLHHHQLTWLRYPSWLWRAMTRYSGHPNRVLVHRYRVAMDRLTREGMADYQIFVTQLAGVGEVRPHLPLDQLSPEPLQAAARYAEIMRPRLNEDFQSLRAEDLAVTGIFLVVRHR